MKKLALYTVILVLTAIISLPSAMGETPSWYAPGGRLEIGDRSPIDGGVEGTSEGIEVGPRIPVDRIRYRPLPMPVDEDMDDDGIINEYDNCATVANPEQEDMDLDDIGDACDDSDEDGFMDDVDNCPARENPDQMDTNEDGIGDVCADSDRDGIMDFEDNCPFLWNLRQSDQDDDGFGDYCDKCRLVFDPGQEDSDGDGIGDACEVDWDGDSIIDDQDNCMLKPNADQADLDDDGIGDVCDPICEGPNCPVVSESVVDEPEVENFDNGCSIVATASAGTNVVSSMALLVLAALSIVAIRKKVK